MEKINWSNLNYDDFERFCSILMTFEYGKAYTPFLAAGPDGGIDGSFIGSYGQHSGKWRFQFKFYQTPRASAIATLKSALKSEIAKLTDENYFVYATNVDLLPADHQVFQDTFAKEITLRNISVELFIWDGAKLDIHAAKYPILSFWLRNGFKTAELRDYKIEYKHNLIVGSLEPDTMSNLFIGRSADLDQLEQFIGSSTPMAIISGEAGIGKTRLALHFFQNYIETLDNWSALALTAYNFDFDKIYKALYPGQNYVVLVDDAHQYSPKVIADLLSLAKQLHNVKLILTARKAEKGSTLQLIRETQQQLILSLEINELSRAETQQIFTGHIRSGHYKQFINELIRISFGKPILIVAMLRAIKNGTPIDKIRSDDFFTLYVRNYFNTYCQLVEGKTGIPVITMQKFLQLVAMMEPFDFNAPSAIETISRTLDISEDHVRFALQQLVQNSYVDGRYQQSIKPDYYSDVILADIDPRTAVDWITELVPYSMNMIVNLACVNDGKASQAGILSIILNNFINIIKATTKAQAANVVLQTILQISQIRKESARYAIETYMAAMSDPKHVLVAELADNQKHNYYSGESSLHLAINILKSLYEFDEHLEFVIRSAYRLYVITAEKRLAEIFSFNRRDILDNFDMRRQNAFVDDLNRRIASLTDREVSFAIEVLKLQASLDFDISQMSAVNLDTISITSYYLTDQNQNVKTYRAKLIQTLIDLYAHEDASIKAAALDLLIDIPRGIFATSHNRSHYVNDQEIRIVLEFLLNNAGTFNLFQQKEILEKLHWFKRWGIAISLQPMVDEIVEALRPESLLEKLSYLFSNAELEIEDLQIDQLVDERSRHMIATESAQELANAILAYLHSQPYASHFFWNFMRIMEQEFPEHAKVLYENAREKPIEIFSLIGPGILSSLYYKHHETDYFWRKIEQLRREGTVEADNIILGTYATRVPDKTPLSPHDRDTIIEIFEKANSGNDYALSMAIQLLFIIKDGTAIAIAKRFLDRVEPQNTRMFFIRLEDNKEASIEEVIDLLLNHTIRFQLGYEIEKLLAKVATNVGSGEIISYFDKRFRHWMELIQRTRSIGNYEFVPRAHHSRILNIVGHGYSLELFEKAMHWFMELKDNTEKYFGKNLISYMKPVKFINDDLYKIYDRLLSQQLDARHLRAVLSTFEAFDEKNDNMLELIKKHYDKINELQFSDPEMYKSVRSEVYSAILALGVKMGTPGQAFPQDIALAELLNKHINILTDFDPVKQFLKDVLKSVQSEIDRTEDLDNSTW